MTLATKLAFFCALLARAAAWRLRRGALKADFRVRLDNHDNVQYSGKIVLGKQALPVIYDTGSFEIIVLSTLCKDCESNGLATYDRSRSASFASAGGMPSHHYFGSGPVTAEQGFESVHIGQQDSPYSAQHMPFYQVINHDMAVWDEDSHFSGIVGLGLTETVPEGYGSHQEGKDAMLSVMGVDRFAFCLERGDSEAPGWLTFGPSVDAQAQGTGHFRSLAVVGKHHWAVKVTGFHAQGLEDLADPCSSGCGAIVDSGGSIIQVPSAASHIVAALGKRLKSDCSNLQEMPVLKMQLGEALVELPPKAYIMQVSVEAPKNSTVYKKLGPIVFRECFMGMAALDRESDYGPVWVLGMPFLRYYHTVFDKASKQLHIAKASPDCRTTSLADTIVQSTMPLNGSTWLCNATHSFGSNATSVQRSGSGCSVFAKVDYEPTQVNLNEVHIPDWTVGAEAGLIRL